MSTDDSMRDADIANGEDPDEANRQPERDQPDRAQDAETESVPTRERQAGENRDNDPPA